MSTTVDIPGGTAYLRDPADMKERHKRLVLTAMAPLADVFAKVPVELAKAASGTGPEAEAASREAQRIVNRNLSRQQAAAMKEVDDAVIVASLSRWTLPDELPTMDTVQDLDADLYTALQRAVSGQSAAVVEASFPTDFSAKPKKDVDAPFGGSSASAGRSRTAASRRTRSTAK